MSDAADSDAPASGPRRPGTKAGRRGHSLEAEIRELLANPAPPDPEGKDFDQVAAEMRGHLTGRRHTETLELLREDRNR